MNQQNAESKLEQAAKDYANEKYPLKDADAYDDEYDRHISEAEHHEIMVNWIHGAKSEAAKEYWQSFIHTSEELNPNKWTIYIDEYENESVLSVYKNKECIVLGESHESLNKAIQSISEASPQSSTSEEEKDLWNEVKEIFFNHYDSYNYPSLAIIELQSKFKISKR